MNRKAQAAAERVHEAAKQALARAKGDQAEAARLLWCRSRRDSCFQNDLARFACDAVVKEAIHE